MSTFNRFEDILAWQKARELTRLVYEATSRDRFCKDFGLSNQIQRASVSIMANIAEGSARRSDKDFASFLNIACSSASEVQSHLYVALDLNYIDQATFSNLYALLDEVSRMLIALARHLQHKTRGDSAPLQTRQTR
jgi:four helix bundle protein